MTRIARLRNFLPLGRRALRVVAWEHGGLVCVLLVALAIRVWLIRWAAGYPTGDIWNFISIAEGLRRFEYPVLEKRLPFYPLLILAARGVFPSASWEGAAVVVACAMSLVALVLLYAIGRTLGLRKAPLLAGLLLFQSFRPFLEASLRGYADTTFLALVLGAILSTLRAHTLRRALLAGLLIGAVPVTRYEGAAMAPVLLVLLLVRFRRRIRAGALIVLMAAIPIVLYAALARANGRSVLPVSYLEETTTTSYGVSSGRELLRNYGMLWEQLGLFEAWKVPTGFARHLVSDPLSLPMWLANLFREPLQATALLAVPGLVFFLVRRPFKQTAAALLPFFALAAPIAWYSSLIKRYTLFLYPLLILAAAAGLHAWSVALARATRRTGWGRIVRLVSAAVILAAAAAVWLPAHTQTAHRGVEKYRHHRLAYYRAVTSARRLPGTIAFETEDSMTNLYFRSRGLYAGLLFQKDAGPFERWESLRARDVSYVVTTTDSAATFAFVRDQPFKAQAKEIAHFAVPQRDGRVDEHVIYQLLYAP